jgi:hypothetical protein
MHHSCHPGRHECAYRFATSSVMPGATVAVRVYLCATFGDMQGERKFLHNHVFPKITTWYASKGVAFQVVDPGWNATEEDAEGVDHLKGALDEVERCRPFFLGLVGQRYGRGLQKIRREVVDAYPLILKAKKGMSRMYLEMLQGVLYNPDKANGSFFYVRRPDFLRQVRKEDCPLFLPANSQEGARRAELVNALKASGRPVTEYSCGWDVSQKRVTGLETLAKHVADDLEKAIHQRLFPYLTLNPELSSILFRIEDAAAPRPPQAVRSPVVGASPLSSPAIAPGPATSDPLVVAAPMPAAPAAPMPVLPAAPVPAAPAVKAPTAVSPMVAPAPVAAAPRPAAPTAPLAAAHLSLQKIVAPLPPAGTPVLPALAPQGTPRPVAAASPIPRFSDKSEAGIPLAGEKNQSLDGGSLLPAQKPLGRDFATREDRKQPGELEMPRIPKNTEPKAERWQDRLIAGTYRISKDDKWKLWLAGCFLGLALVAVFVFVMLCFFPGQLQGWLDVIQATFH